MKDKSLCINCKWHGTIGARAKERTDICCDYGLHSGNGTALKMINGEVVDTRGKKYDKCLLFEEGESVGGKEVSNEFRGSFSESGALLSRKYEGKRSAV